MTVRRVLVTGTRQPLGAAVAARLSRRADVALIEEPTGSTGYEAIAELIVEGRVDALVHASMVSWSPGMNVDVIATMRLAAALAQPRARVRAVAVASSTAVYPASAAAPLFHHESEVLDPPADGAAARVLEAEGYLRSLAETRPDLTIAVLRLADLAGSPAVGPLPRMLKGPLVPAVAGFDPAVQLLDIDDAATGLEHAIEHAWAGIYNVACPRPLRWSQATRLAGGHAVPLPRRVWLPGWVEPIMRLNGALDLVSDTLDVLRFGRAVDTTLMAGGGFTPARSTESCAALSGGRRLTRPRRPDRGRDPARST